MSDDLANPDLLREMADRLERLFDASPTSAAATMRAAADEIERLRVELETWKRMAHVPDGVTPADFGMVPAGDLHRTAYGWCDRAGRPIQLWRMPDER